MLDGAAKIGAMTQAAADYGMPAIAVTAFSRVQDRADALAAGFQAHLAKPVKAESLISAVANLSRK